MSEAANEKNRTKHKKMENLELISIERGVGPRGPGLYLCVLKMKNFFKNF
jgi:hypothetical protein